MHIYDCITFTGVLKLFAKVFMSTIAQSSATASGKVFLGLRVSRQLRKRLAIAALEADKSNTELCTVALENFLDQLENKNKELANARP